MLFARRHIAIVAGAIILGGIVAAFGRAVVTEPSLEYTRIAKLESDIQLLSLQVGNLNDRMSELAARNTGPPAPPALTLSADAEDMLRAAAKDNHGQIYLTEITAFGEAKARKVPPSEMHVRSAEREFCVDKTPRSYARWRAALEELTRLNYVELARSDDTRATYRLTQVGYNAADHLPAAMVTQE